MTTMDSDHTDKIMLKTDGNSRKRVFGCRKILDHVKQPRTCCQIDHSIDTTLIQIIRYGHRIGTYARTHSELASQEPSRRYSTEVWEHSGSPCALSFAYFYDIHFLLSCFQSLEIPIYIHQHHSITISTLLSLFKRSLSAYSLLHISASPSYTLILYSVSPL